jgi:GntR family transcriptional regulator
MLQRNLPLVDQAAQQILAQIETETIAREDGLLPSEDELARQFNVSRATVRGALDKLESAGIIFRRQGVGTFLDRSMTSPSVAVRGWLDEARAFMDLIRDSNRDAARKIVDTRVGPAGSVAGCLGMVPTDPVVVIEKLFFSESVPIIHCVNIVPLALIEPESVAHARELYEAAESTYQFLDRWCHVRVNHQRSEIRAVPAEEAMARHLDCRPGVPLLLVEEVGYTTEARPVFYGLNHFRGDMVGFQQVRHPALNIARGLIDKSGD